MIIIYAVGSPNVRSELPRCARHTPRTLRVPSNFEHVKKNRRAIAEHTLRSRCAVNAQCRRQLRRACVECTQPLREWLQLIRECTRQLIREWLPHQRRISTHHCQTNTKLMLCVPYQFAQTGKPTPFLRYTLSSDIIDEYIDSPRSVFLYGTHYILRNYS